MNKKKITGVLLIIGYVIILCLKLFVKNADEITMMMLLFMTGILACMDVLGRKRFDGSKGKKTFFIGSIVIFIFMYIVYLLSIFTPLDIAVKGVFNIIVTISNFMFIIGRLLIKYFED